MRDIRDLSIDEANLDKELCEQAATYLYVAEKAIVAEAAYRNFKLQLGVLNAQLSAKLREELEVAGKKVTEKMLDAAIELDPTYMDAQRRAIILQTQMQVLKAAVDAWYMRHSTLKELAMKSRNEMMMLSSSVARDEAA